jgi:hypothetical protein
MSIALASVYSVSVSAQEAAMSKVLLSEADRCHPRSNDHQGPHGGSGFGVGRMFGIFNEGRRLVGVFRNLAEAEQWLDMQ